MAPLTFHVGDARRVITEEQKPEVPESEGLQRALTLFCAKHSLRKKHV